MKPVPFGRLQPGERFEWRGEAWRKLDTSNEAQHIHNAMMLSRRHTEWLGFDFLVTPLVAPSLSFWRRWLLTRSLRWQVAGFTWWARWSWRLGRMLATEKTQQAMAAHVAGLLMMGEQ